ncbi:MAG: hypothetical protein JKY01_10115, partial [Pseudomonadales bacterium]|nr:hypothetical protein [Pseudomonadales bacterium]
MKYLKEAVLSAMAMSLAACGGGNAEIGVGQTGNLQLSITDAPLDGAQAVN